MKVRFQTLSLIALAWFAVATPQALYAGTYVYHDEKGKQVRELKTKKKSEKDRKAKQEKNSDRVGKLSKLKPAGKPYDEPNPELAAKLGKEKK